jgi:hypothetical protein
VTAGDRHQQTQRSETHVTDNAEIMTDRIDIHDPITELCKRLGLEPTDVAEIVFKPRHVTVTVYLKDAQGAKYLTVTKDGRKGIASETRSFQVAT